MTKTMVMTTVVPTRPSPRPARKSANVSPTVVESTLITQKYRVTSGTLFSSCRAVLPPAGASVIPERSAARSERRLNASGVSIRWWGTIGAVAEVLVVEDDDALRGAVARALRERDLVVTTAADGAGALAAVGSGPDTRFAAVVLDIGLPDSDGRDVCQALRARGIDIPILFLTARDQLHDLLSGYAAGGDAYLTKPFHVPKLVVS